MVGKIAIADCFIHNRKVNAEKGSQIAEGSCSDRNVTMRCWGPSAFPTKNMLTLRTETQIR